MFASQKVLEIRFDGLNEDRTSVKSIPNDDNRHSVNQEEFMKAFMNLISALNNYGKHITGRYLVGKMLGMM